MVVVVIVGYWWSVGGGVVGCWLLRYWLLVVDMTSGCSTRNVKFHCGIAMASFGMTSVNMRGSWD